jgi:glutamate synthase (ferredoxin)
MFNPTTIAKLQQAVRLNSPESYKEYSLWSTIKVKNQ